MRGDIITSKNISHCKRLSRAELSTACNEMKHPTRLAPKNTQIHFTDCIICKEVFKMQLSEILF